MLCAGQLVADILVRPVEKIDFSTDTVKVDEIRTSNGGDCMNVAVGLSKLACRVGFSGRVGRDSFGESLKKVLERHGIDISGLTVDETAQTSAAVCLVSPGGERSFLYSGGANDRFTVKHICAAQLEQSRIVYVGGVYLLPGLEPDLPEFFRAAKKMGKITAMDVTWDTSGRWLSVIEPCLPYLDYFLPSISEARQIARTDDSADIARFLLAKGVTNVVIKRGKDGCWAAGPDECFSFPAYETNVVDTTGAGDAFVSGFLAGVVRGKNLRECAALGSAAAAFCIGALGATTAEYDYEEICRFSEERHGQ